MFSAQSLYKLGQHISRKKFPITVIVTTAAAAGTMQSLHTPVPSGSYGVGCSDLMIGKSREGTLMRIFYPSPSTDLSDKSKWTNWFIGEEYTKGMATFMAPSIPYIFKQIFNWKMRGALVPAIWEAPVVDEPKIPVVIFSHGLSASRTFYSSVCAELASHGFFVAAIEHRDESACASFTLSDSGEEQWIPFAVLSPGQKEYDLRFKQVQIRVEETIRAINSLEAINEGNVTNELKSNFDIRQLKGKLDFSQIVMSGHSFGAATTILSLAKDSRLKIGVALDPWMFPLKDVIESQSKIITQKPLICINTEAFQSEANMNAMEKLEADSTVFVTIRGTVHQNQCDAPFLAGPIGRVFVGASSNLDYDTAMQVNNKLILQFICKHLGINNNDHQKAIIDSYLKENSHNLAYGLFSSSAEVKQAFL